MNFQIGDVVEAIRHDDRISDEGIVFAIDTGRTPAVVLFIALAGGGEIAVGEIGYMPRTEIPSGGSCEGDIRIVARLGQDFWQPCTDENLLTGTYKGVEYRALKRFCKDSRDLIAAQ